MNKSEHTRTFGQELKIWTARIIPFAILFGGSSLIWDVTIRNRISSLQYETVSKIVKEDLNQRISEDFKKKSESELRSQIQESLSKELFARKDALAKVDESSPLGRIYISKEIEKQAEDKAKQIVKDEIGQAKSDLVSQIAFPVVFAIASIFAAFAVKDILTEVIKKEEKGVLKNEIIESLEQRLGIPEQNKEEDFQSLWSIIVSKIQEIEDTKPKLITQFIQEHNKKLALIKYRLDSLSLDVIALRNLRNYIEKDDHNFARSIESHLIQVQKSLNYLESVDENMRGEINSFRAYENISCALLIADNKSNFSSDSVSVTDFPSIGDPFNEISEIILFKAELLLNEFKNSDIFSSDENSYKNKVETLEAAINNYKNRFQKMQSSLHEIEKNKVF